MWVSCLIILAHNDCSFRYHKTGDYLGSGTEGGKDFKEAQEIFGILITCCDAGCDFKEKTTIKIKKFFISNRYIQSKLFFNKIDETNPPLTHRKHTKTCINN